MFGIRMPNKRRWRSLLRLQALRGMENLEHDVLTRGARPSMVDASAAAMVALAWGGLGLGLFGYNEHIFMFDSQ